MAPNITYTLIAYRPDQSCRGGEDGHSSSYLQIEYQRSLNDLFEFGVDICYINLTRDFYFYDEYVLTLLVNGVNHDHPSKYSWEGITDESRMKVVTEADLFLENIKKAAQEQYEQKKIEAVKKKQKEDEEKAELERKNQEDHERAEFERLKKKFGY